MSISQTPADPTKCSLPATVLLTESQQHSNKPATHNSGNHSNSQNYMYVLQEPTGYNNLQQIIATPVLLTVTGKLITATMNPMDLQQQYTATKNSSQLLSVQPDTCNCSNLQQHWHSNTHGQQNHSNPSPTGCFFFFKKTEGLINTTATKCLWGELSQLSYSASI